MLTGVVSLLMALTISLLITRVAAVALMLTGLSQEAASFQARSAFSGVGFTTSESETIVGHPVRRRVIKLLMLLGNVGVATVAATVIVSLTSAPQSTAQQFLGVSLLLFGLVLLWFFWSSQWLERKMNVVIAWALRKWAKLDVRDYVALLQLANGYAVTEMLVEAGDWLENKTLKQLRLPDEGILILGIRDETGEFRGTPVGDDVLRAQDTLILYGAIDRIEELDQRRAGREGDIAHVEAVQEQIALEEQYDEERSDEPVATDSQRNE